MKANILNPLMHSVVSFVYQRLSIINAELLILAFCRFVPYSNTMH
jgi:hypothetical protein